MGSFGPSGPAGALALAASLVLAGLLEHIQYRLKRTEQSAWWGSNGRDVVNAVALCVVFAGLGLYGFEGPLVLGLAGTLVLALSMVQTGLESHPHARGGSVLAALLLGVPLLVAPLEIAARFDALVRVLVP